MPINKTIAHLYFPSTVNVTMLNTKCRMEHCLHCVQTNISPYPTITCILSRNRNTLVFLPYWPKCEYTTTGVIFPNFTCLRSYSNSDIHHIMGSNSLLVVLGAPHFRYCHNMTTRCRQTVFQCLFSLIKDSINLQGVVDYVSW